ncbi:D-glycero-alpha-D-manno-heptose-1,7-bisphosphate 7-phosphatase [Comamonas sp. GB3 AK4-5]|uniref:D-glycero-alpha-D-manno-heptose-1,7-bisphosphate 7-phosphatase n=1 Tax=Comamonas sp. GB3 AK4-5 TaxID=3231487 RepID=UPI00351E0A1F
MKLAILDRIGTFLPEGEDAIVPAQDWQPQPGVVDAIAQLNRAGWHVVVATNQPGLGRGSVDVNELNALHQRMHRELALAGARIEAVFYCPHAPDEGCHCRKPAPGLMQQIAARYGAEPHEIWVVGQDHQHLNAGAAVGAHLLWVEQGCGGPMPGQPPSGEVQHYADWLALAQALAPAPAEDAEPVQARSISAPRPAVH